MAESIFYPLSTAAFLPSSSHIAVSSFLPLISALIFQESCRFLANNPSSPQHRVFSKSQLRSTHFCFHSQLTLGLLYNLEATSGLRGVGHSMRRYTDMHSRMSIPSYTLVRTNAHTQFIKKPTSFIACMF